MFLVFLGQFLNVFTFIIKLICCFVKMQFLNF